jgi:hypothetical protein
MRATSLKMDWGLLVHWLRVIAAILAAIWALIVVYDLVIANASVRRIALHTCYAIASLAFVALSLLAKR